MDQVFSTSINHLKMWVGTQSEFRMKETVIIIEETISRDHTVVPTMQGLIKVTSSSLLAADRRVRKITNIWLMLTVNNMEIKFHHTVETTAPKFKWIGDIPISLRIRSFKWLRMLLLTSMGAQCYKELVSVALIKQTTMAPTTTWVGCLRATEM